MKIGIIGSGNIGGALTRRFRTAGHEVTIANSRGPASLADLTHETGAQAAFVEQVARCKDVVVVAIPMKNVGDLPPDLFDDAPADLVVVDTSNYYPQQRDGLIEGIEAGIAESVWVAQTLKRPAVKAFNTIIAKHLLENGKPAGAAGRIALPIAGDNPIAKAKVTRLVDDIGFDAVDAGSLVESWRQQPGSPVYLKDYDARGVRQAISEARRERGPEWRATPNSPGTYAVPA